jgi:hypothetical protein
LPSRFGFASAPCRSINSANGRARSPRTGYLSIGSRPAISEKKLIAL